MTPNQVFWTLALLWTAALVVVALRGFVHIRRGDVEAHRRSMNGSIVMVGVFVVAYVFKVVFLGKEGVHLWSLADRAILYSHETMVAIMLLAGGRARWLARRVGKPDGAAGFAAPGRAKQHRLAGRAALIAGAMALFTAALVLLGMLGRGG